MKNKATQKPRNTTKTLACIGSQACLKKKKQPNTAASKLLF